MCGISAIIGSKNAPLLVTDILIEQASRGRDATGIAWINSLGNLEVLKGAISPIEFKDKYEKRIKVIGSTISVGHNRAATSNLMEKQKDSEAHPFISENKDFVLLQNGSVSNNEQLQVLLEGFGHKFSSKIDSEVLLHILEEFISRNKTREEAITKFNEIVSGNVIVLFKDGEIFGFPSSTSFNIIKTQYCWIIASEVKPVIDTLKKYSIEMNSLYTPSDDADFVRISDKDNAIRCYFHGKWDQMPFKEGTWIYDHKTMCDFCGTSSVPCESIKIQGSDKDRCIECYKKKITTLRNSGCTSGYNNGWKGPMYPNYTSVSKLETRTNAVAICCKCHFPATNDDTIFCLKCQKFFCKLDFKEHNCKDSHNKEDFHILDFLNHLEDGRDLWDKEIKSEEKKEEIKEESKDEETKGKAIRQPSIWPFHRMEEYTS